MPFDLETMYPKLVNLLLDPVFVVDESGNIVFVTGACESLLGYAAAEMIGTLIFDYLHPDDRERTRAEASRVTKGHAHINYENRYIHKDGQTVHILWSARWSEEHGLRIGLARNVTSLRRANQTRDALYRISEAAHSADSLYGICDGVRQVIAELFPHTDLHLAFYDPEQSVLAVPDWSVDRTNDWLEGAMQPGTALAEVIGSGQTLLASRDPSQPGLGAITQSGPKPPDPANWLGMPLISKDSVLGALVIESQSEHTRYDAADQELLQFVAIQVATVVERKRAEDHLRFLAHHDPLTGLTNRSLFYDRLETALKAASRHNSQVALLYLDLNDFKQINDTLGHEAGDQLLIETARRLETCTRDTDTVARMGGDEFTVLLTDVGNLVAVDAVVGKIREAMAVPMMQDGQVVLISCSIGVALYPADGSTARHLLGSADSRMYEHKPKRRTG